MRKHDLVNFLKLILYCLYVSINMRKSAYMVNTFKINFCLFFQSRRTHTDFVWTYNGVALEVMDSFCYLRARFYLRSILKLCFKTLSDKE